MTTSVDIRLSVERIAEQVREAGYPVTVDGTVGVSFLHIGEPVPNGEGHELYPLVAGPGYTDQAWGKAYLYPGAGDFVIGYDDGGASAPLWQDDGTVTDEQDIATIIINLLRWI